MLMRQHALVTRAAEGAIALVPTRHVEFPGDVQHLVQLPRWRLVGERGRRTDPDLRRLAHPGRRARSWQPAEPARVQVQPPRHRVDQRHLEIEGGLVAGNPVLAEPLQHRADVLVLELDGPLGPVVQQRNPRRSGRCLHLSTSRSTLRQAMDVKSVCHQRLLAGFWLASNAAACLRDRPPRNRPPDRPAISCRSPPSDYVANGTTP